MSRRLSLLAICPQQEGAALCAPPMRDMELPCLDLADWRAGGTPWASSRPIHTQLKPAAADSVRTAYSVRGECRGGEDSALDSSLACRQGAGLGGVSD